MQELQHQQLLAKGSCGRQDKVGEGRRPPGAAGASSVQWAGSKNKTKQLMHFKACFSHFSAGRADSSFNRVFPSLPMRSSTEMTRGVKYHAIPDNVVSTSSSPFHDLHKLSFDL